MALKVHHLDNVATVFENISAQSLVTVVDKKKDTEDITVKDDIPYGHKFAVLPIKKGGHIIKYGEEIGIASAEISVGEHVHIHNMESARGRGDWDKEANK